MTLTRLNSLSPLNLKDWLWQPIFNDMLELLSIFKLQNYPIPVEFLYKRVVTGNSKKPIEITTSTWASKFTKVKQIRAACIQGSGSLSVLNLVIIPSVDYNLPFFGADFVTLPNGHLLALDLQPVLKNDRFHTDDVWKKLLPIHNRWQSLLPDGGDIPTEAKQYFSPGFLWTRLPLEKNSNLTIQEVIRPAFREYLSLYLELVSNAERVSKDFSLKLQAGQKSYLNYRSFKDPARGMLTRFYGKEWTEDYIHKVLFKID